MRIFRRNGIGDEQVREILRSLPQVQAPADFEDRLGRSIEAQKHEVPHILGNLPRVPAPDDFDAKLMQAIRERRRPVAPIAAPIAGAGMRVNWLNSVAGWVGGALMIMALAFFVDRSGVMSQDGEEIPVRTPASAAQPAPAFESADAPAAAPISSPARETASTAMTAPAASRPAARIASAQPAVRIAPTAKAAPSKAVAPVVTVQAPKEEKVRQTDEHTQVSAPVQAQRPAASGAAAEPDRSTSVPVSVGDAEPEVASQDKTSPTDSVPEGVVNTGGERDNAEEEKP